MDKDAVLNIIIEFKNTLEAKGVKINKIILYGSYAAGNFRACSDIDIVVISNDFEGKGYRENELIYYLKLFMKFSNL